MVRSSIGFNDVESLPKAGPDARAVCAGSGLTQAALDAGFASGAHFSDTFRTMFGLPPSRLVEWGVRWRALPGATVAIENARE